MFQTFYSCEKSISRTMRYFPLRNFSPCTTLECDNVATFYYPGSNLLSDMWSLTGGEKQKKIANF